MSLAEIKDRPLNIAVLTVSDTRDKTTDKGGQLLIKYLEDAKHHVKFYDIVTDDYFEIRSKIHEWTSSEDLDAIITTGGTGIAYRDVTLEAVNSLYEKKIPGFGEIFRYLSFTEDIGTKAIASRASAGIYRKKLIFSLPGSTGAIKLGMEKIILKEIAHLIYEINK